MLASARFSKHRVVEKAHSTQLPPLRAPEWAVGGAAGQGERHGAKGACAGLDGQQQTSLLASLRPALHVAASGEARRCSATEEHVFLADEAGASPPVALPAVQSGT